MKKEPIKYIDLELYDLLDDLITKNYRSICEKVNLDQWMGGNYKKVAEFLTVQFLKLILPLLEKRLPFKITNAFIIELKRVIYLVIVSKVHGAMLDIETSVKIMKSQGINYKRILELLAIALAGLGTRAFTNLKTMANEIIIQVSSIVDMEIYKDLGFEDEDDIEWVNDPEGGESRPPAEVCPDCLKLNGVVKKWREWKKHGIPRSGICRCYKNCRCFFRKVVKKAKKSYNKK